MATAAESRKSANSTEPIDTTPVRPFPELRATGLLWLINRQVFHPRGYALGLAVNDAGDILGWSLLGDGSEAWSFDPDDEAAEFAAAQKTLSPKGE